MSEINSFSNKIDAKESLEYRYYEITRKYRKLVKEILMKNNKEVDNQEYLYNELTQIMILYPEKQELIQKISNMYYSEILLTENSLTRLINLYNELHQIIE